MKARTILTLSIVAGVAAVVLMYLHLKQSEGDRWTVFRTTAPIKAGTPIGALAVPITLPAKFYPNLLTEAPRSDMEAFVRNTPAKENIGLNEIVLYRHLESTVEPGIRAKIPHGMKAASIPVDAVNSVAYFVEPGDIVDILASVPDLATNTMTSKPVLQAVEVLAVGDRYRKGEAMRPAMTPYPTVTLLLSLEEAEKLAIVREAMGGQLTLLLRNPEDTEKDESARALSLGDPDFDTIGNRRSPAQ